MSYLFPAKSKFKNPYGNMRALKPKPPTPPVNNQYFQRSPQRPPQMVEPVRDLDGNTGDAPRLPPQRSRRSPQMENTFPERQGGIDAIRPFQATNQAPNQAANDSHRKYINEQHRFIKPVKPKIYPNVAQPVPGSSYFPGMRSNKSVIDRYPEMSQGSQAPGSQAPQGETRPDLYALYLGWNKSSGMDDATADMMARQRVAREGNGVDPETAVEDVSREAEANNQARYAQLMGLADESRGERMTGLNNNYSQLFGLVGKGTEASVERNRRREASDRGRVAQSLTNRGMVNTTNNDVLQRGVTDDTMLREQEIFNRARQEEINARQRYTGDLLNLQNDTYQEKSGVIERRTDAPPNLSQYYGALSQPGAAGGGLGALSAVAASRGRGGGSTAGAQGGWSRPNPITKQPAQPAQPAQKPSEYDWRQKQIAVADRIRKKKAQEAASVAAKKAVTKGLGKAAQWLK